MFGKITYACDMPKIEDPSKLTDEQKHEMYMLNFNNMLGSYLAHSKSSPAELNVSFMTEAERADLMSFLAERRCETIVNGDVITVTIPLLTPKNLPPTVKSGQEIDLSPEDIQRVLAFIAQLKK